MKLVSFLFVGVFALSPLWSDDIGDVARKVLQGNEKAVIRINVVIKQSVSFGGQGGRNRESKKEILGTLIDPTGLTLVSLSRIDPGAALSGSGGEAHGFEIKTELSGIKMLLADGKEIPAKVILRDKDLDIAFVAPEQKPSENNFSFISLENKTKKAVEIMDQGILLTRAEKIAKRVSMVNLLRINAIVSKPRTFYISDGITALGTPVFATDASLIGITLIRMNLESADAMFGGESDAVYIILPVDEMTEVVTQAKEEMEKQWSGSTEEKKEEK